MKHAAPASETQPAKAWAAISEDAPPVIYDVAWWREHLRADLRHIRVMIVPIAKKQKRKSR